MSSTTIKSIERVSELPFFGPEEQIRKFVNQHDEVNSSGSLLIDSSKTQIEITQSRIGNIDDILQKQFIWSYIHPSVGEAYFYWDWCKTGEEDSNSEWSIVEPTEASDNLERDIDRVFDYRKFVGVRNDTSSVDEMPIDYSALTDEHAKEQAEVDDGTNIDVDTARHNIMRSYIELSEWLGAGATEYGSHNGYVSRKMSLAWLFDAIRALINFKMANQDKYAQENINPLDVDGKEKFLDSNEQSPRGINYNDYLDLDQINGRCAKQVKVRAKNPNTEGTLKVRGNAWFYGERADFYTHNSFLGECRFFHNTKFLGQATFDKEINGTAMRSRWADLAEMKEADGVYAPGTLVMFGGEKEVTISDGRHCNAIVTTNPGLILNGQSGEGKQMVGIALTGTVPVNVVGEVKKFDRLVPSRKYPGCARRKGILDFFRKPIGIALTDKYDGKVQCITKMEF